MQEHFANLCSVAMRLTGRINTLSNLTRHCSRDRAVVQCFCWAIMISLCFTAWLSALDTYGCCRITSGSQGTGRSSAPIR